METIATLSEFVQVYESHLYAIILCCLALFGGLFVFVNVAADLGFLLYRFGKKALRLLCSKLWERVECAVYRHFG